MSRVLMVLVAFVALFGTSAAVDVSMSFSNGADTQYGRFGTAGIGASGSLESYMSFDMSGVMVNRFGHQDIVDSGSEFHSVLSEVDGQYHIVNFCRTPFYTSTMNVDGDSITGTYTQTGTFTQL